MLEDSWNSGNIIGIPSLDVRIAKVDSVFPIPPKTAEEVKEGFLSEFPHVILTIPDQNGTQIRADMQWPTYPEWENTYIAVNAEGIHQATPLTPEKIDLRVGEIVVSREIRPDLVIDQILTSPSQVTMEPGIEYSVRSRQDWAIYHHQIMPLTHPHSK